jgi:hypothetical protein
MAGLLDLLVPSSDGGGLLDFLKRNAQMQPLMNGLPSDRADYGPTPATAGSAPAMRPAASAPMAAPPAPAPQQPPAMMPAPAGAAPAAAPPLALAPAAPTASPGGDFGDHFMTGYQNFRHGGGLLGSIVASITGQRNDPLAQVQQQQQQVGNVTARALIGKGVEPQVAIAAVQPGNGEMLKQLVDQYFGPSQIDNLGSGYIRDKRSGKVTRAYEPDDKTPQSVLEYQYYKQTVPPDQQPMDFATWSTAKARAGATNISNNIDMNSGQTYDKQLAEGLGKSHAALANGVEDAQTRARDIAAMQGAIDAIQRNGGTTGGMGQTQILELKKSINSGLSAVGIDKPFNESDISDKEFLTKFNRSMAGAQAKNSVGSRVTNFEMGNFMKANPGLDMSVTGNQRLLGIQAQIEQRNIAVGNAIREATAAAISKGQKIDPVTVQKIISDYDTAHHVKDPVTGQDLTQSYALPEFQNNGASNKSMSEDHATNIRRIEKTIGSKHYFSEDGGKSWYVH